MNAKAKGSRNEHKSIKLLEAAGYRCTRAAASLGIFDIVAIGADELPQAHSRVERSPARAGSEGDLNQGEGSGQRQEAKNATTVECGSKNSATATCGGSEDEALSERQEKEIDPKLKVLLMAVRAGLLQIAGAIEDYLGIEKKRSVCARCRGKITVN